MYRMLYNYFLTKNKVELRDIIREMSVQDKRQYGSLIVNERKLRKVNKLLLHASQQIVTGALFENLFAPEYEKWLNNLKNMNKFFPVAPPIYLLRATVPKEILPRQTADQSQVIRFCRNKFASLLDLLI